ncbi:unnamed protein product [Cyprideis torosa]|uniref:Uncharacterized protein n=1 Tax=Cyprideis torosa TaxID=163714 RepID=A0A7R8W543_9CRUS|nr:unnamed protein product [Cyprideis torosa]CAG0880503.1 unnamed protein product [Cyprideis torosa]
MGVLPNPWPDYTLNRVSLKIEVSYTDHSHIIGRGGRSIKSVMDSTNCHVHFPDSNRFSATEKCNQVSIAGEPQQVELARRQVRRLTPILFMLEIPIPLDLHSNSPASVIQRIQQEYRVQVFIRGHGRQCCVAVVKGNAWELREIKEATLSLMHNYHLDPVQSVMEKYNVLVSTKPKPRAANGTRMLVIKGVERRISDVFEARRVLLNLLHEPQVKVEIPPTYELPMFPPPFMNFGAFGNLFHPTLWPQNTPSSFFPWTGNGNASNSQFSPAPSPFSTPSISPRGQYDVYAVSSDSGHCSPEKDLLDRHLENARIEKMEKVYDRQRLVFPMKPTKAPTAPTPPHLLSPHVQPQTTGLSASSCLDSVLPPYGSKELKDLPTLFSRLGLMRYIDLFQQQDVDLATFLTLAEDDLANLGVNTFGARRKMMLAIQGSATTPQRRPLDIGVFRGKDGGLAFSGSAAVGAERRSSSSNLSGNGSW